MYRGGSDREAGLPEVGELRTLLRTHFTQAQGDRHLSTDSPKADLDELVERTRGFQPWRKVFHAFNGIAVFTAIEVFGLPAGTAAAMIGGLAAPMLALDGLRLLHRPANELFFRWFGALVSPREAEGLASSTWYALGAAVALAVFPVEHALSGILVLGLADPTASYVGHRWGGRPLLGGTVAGTATFLLVGVTILILRHPVAVALPAAAITALAERRSWPLDDNFAIPVASAAVTAGMALLLG